MMFCMRIIGMKQITKNAVADPGEGRVGHGPLGPVNISH